MQPPECRQPVGTQNRMAFALGGKPENLNHKKAEYVDQSLLNQSQIRVLHVHHFDDDNCLRASKHLIKSKTGSKDTNQFFGIASFL